MDVASLIQDPTLIVLASGLLLAATYMIVVSSSTYRWDKLISSINLYRSNAAILSTTQSTSPPEKHGIATEETSATELRDLLPPSRRDALAQCKLLTEVQPRSSTGSSGPMRASSMLKTHTTPTGFTEDDIRRLGHFPDYAMLSGVPLPQPYHAFDITKARPRPYRPLRWAYHQTMALSKMEPDWWLELENTYAERIAQRQQLFKKYGDMVLQALPGSELAIKELMEMCLQFLCARYPHYFRLDLESLIFYNGILHTESHLQAEHPLHVLLNNVPEDFACTLRDEDGTYTFKAGIICSSLGWNVGSKIGLNLQQIHEPIPDYKEKMQRSMDRYFAKKPTDKPIQRGSWGLEIDKPLFMPPGDPHEKLRAVQDPSHTLDRCHLRVDWQTLRRLPLSGSIVFNFKALFTPVTEFRDEPYIPSLLVKILKDGKKSLMEYKNTWHTEHIVIPAMEQYEREQIERGMVEKDWQAHTLDETPYFRGWEEKWHHQQGF